MTKMGAWRVAVPFLAMVGVMAVVPAWAQETVPQDAVVPPALTCNKLMQQMLPGNYYFCVASHRLEKGNYKAALSFMEYAAAWGNKAAQSVLGIAYFNGEGVERNRPSGLAGLGCRAPGCETTWLVSVGAVRRE